MSAIYPPENQQSPPQPPPLPAPPKRHRVRKTLLIIGGAFLALILLIVIISVATAKPTKPAAGTNSAPAPTHMVTKPAAVAPAHVSTVTACNELGAWENGPATDVLNKDPESKLIIAQTSGTQFGTDFAQWMSDSAAVNVSAAITDAQTVSADCVAAGAADPLNNNTASSAPASSAPAAPAADTVIAKFYGTSSGSTGTFTVPADGN
jgi:hypothetical protein